MNDLRPLRYLSLVLGVLLVSILASTATLILARNGAFDQQPFDRVKVTSVSRSGYEVNIKAQYRKVACEIERIVVFGTILGEVTPLDYVPYRGPNIDEDRLEGQQAMEIIVDMAGVKYDNIEVRTRHNCEGRHVDNVFLAVEVPK